MSRSTGKGARSRRTADNVHVRLVHELLLWPIFYRLLFSRPIDRRLGTRLVDAVLDRFAPPAP
jgi:hypothetical protein